MAKDNGQSNTLVTDEAGDALDAGSNLALEQKQSANSPLPGQPIPIVLGKLIPGTGAVINRVSVDNRFVETGSQINIVSGSFISVSGSGLNIFDDDKWKLYTSNGKLVNLQVVLGGQGKGEDGRLSGRFVTLRVPNSSVSGFGENENLDLVFFSHAVGGRFRTLPIKFVFGAEKNVAEPSEPIKKKVITPMPVAETTPGTKTVKPLPNNQNFSEIIEFINNTKEIFTDLAVRERILKLLMKNPWGKIPVADQKLILEEFAQLNMSGKLPKEVQLTLETLTKVKLESIRIEPKIKGIGKKPGSALEKIQDSEVDMDAEELEEPVQKTAEESELALDFNTSVNLVKQYIEDNPLVISNAKIKRNIQTALGTGDFSALNKAEQVVLQAVIKNIGSNLQGELKVASNIVGEVASKQVGSSASMSASVQSSQTGGQIKTDQTQTFQSKVGSQAQAQVEKTSKSDDIVGSQSSVEAGVQIAGLAIPNSDLSSLVAYLSNNNSIPASADDKSKLLNNLTTGRFTELPDTETQILLNLSQDNQAPLRVQDLAKKLVSQTKLTSSALNPKLKTSAVKSQSIGNAPNQLAKLRVEKKLGAQKDKAKEEYQNKLAQMRKREANLPVKASLPVMSGSDDAPKAGKIQVNLPVSGSVVGNTSTNNATNSPSDVITTNRPALSVPALAEDEVNEQSSLPEATSPNLDLTKPEAQSVDASGSQAQSILSMPPKEAEMSKTDFTPTDDSVNPESLSALEANELARQRQAEATLQQAREVLAGQQRVKSLEVKQAEELVNKELDVILNRLAFLVWASIIPSFGFSILIGAVLGDIIWLFGPRVLITSGKLTNWVMSKMPIKSPLNQVSDALSKIEPKLSVKVKLQILLMNIIILSIIILFIVILTVVLYDICSSKLTYLSADAYNINAYCPGIKDLVEGIIK